MISSANLPSEMAAAMASLGAAGVIHRFLPIGQQVAEVRKAEITVAHQNLLANKIDHVTFLRSKLASYKTAARKANLVYNPGNGAPPKANWSSWCNRVEAKLNKLYPGWDA